MTYAARMTGESERLRQARKAAGFATAADAAARFGWNYPTYAGHENGQRGLKTDVAKAYAKAFRVESSWLLFGTGPSEPALTMHAMAPPPGLAESEVEPFFADTRREERQIEQLAEALAPSLRQRMIYRAARNYGAYAILEGDLLVIDPTGAMPRPGAIAIVTLADPETGAASSVLRQAAGETFIAPPGMKHEDEDTMSKAALGTVVAVMRPASA